MEGPQNFKGMRILVVEDEDDIAQLIRFNLEEEGFLVTISGNGLDALSKLERNLPDAIILDLMLPGMGGVEILKKIRAKFDVPVVLVTARAGETDAVLGLEMGADDYVRKPLSPRELV
ncbi:MAG TPA: response regulator, partial [Leptospiraceae bacterium]|nr:response regulator [Leptospiraceae bacterium]